MGKMLHTPAGDFPMPRGTTAMLAGLSDEKLLEAYISNYEKTSFIDPFLFQEMQDRKLVFPGEYHQDIVKRLEELQERAGTAPARLFVDMDGTLAVFRSVDTLETLYEPGYFAELAPQENVIQAIRSIIRERPDIEVFILSAVLGDSKYALNEKKEWLDQHLPEIDAEHRIFPPCGADKKEYIPGGVRETDFLLDDYTHNLTLWHPPGHGIKLLNGINHSRGTWEQDRIRFDRDPAELAAGLVGVITGRGRVLDEKPEITGEAVLKELKDQAWNTVFSYSENYAMTQPKKGFDQEWAAANAKAAIIDKMAEDFAWQPNVVSPDRETELQNLFWAESNDPETQEWRENLTPAEAALVDKWDNNYVVASGRIAKKILELEQSKTREKPTADLQEEIKGIVDALNTSYEKTGRSDRWSFHINGMYEGPWIYNPLYFAGNAYEGSLEELQVQARQLYALHFGVEYSPGLPAPEAPAPFFGRIDYLNSQGLPGETVLHTDEAQYLRALNEKYEYGVPLAARRLTADEYRMDREELAAEQVAEEDDLER